MSAVHLENMLNLARLGVIIFPPMPSFYHKPSSLQDVIDQTVGRILERMGLENDLVVHWNEAKPQHCRGGRTMAMHTHIRLRVATAGEGRLRVAARAAEIGPDILVTLTGGELDHIGAVAVSVACPSLADPSRISGTPSVITLPSHKEDLVAVEAALYITRATSRNVVVTAGLHVDHAASSDIETLVQNARSAIKALASQLAP